MSSFSLPTTERMFYVFVHSDFSSPFHHLPILDDSWEPNKA